MPLKIDYLKTLSPADRKKEILLEYYKCSNDLKYCIENYFTVLAGKERIPFKLYPHQIDSVNSYEAYTNSILMKTRQMGLTTVTAVYVAVKSIFNNNFKTVIISKDFTSAKEFLKEIKDMLDTARKDYPWLVPDYKPGYNNKQNFILANGSLVKAEGGDQAGRGTPGATLVVIDEVAYIDKKYENKMTDIWSAISPTLASTKGKAIMISTPAGTNGWYYETYTNAKEKGFHIIDAHWTQHPIYSLGQYRWVIDNTKKEKGYLQFFDKPWPETIFDKEAGTYIELKKEDYPFVCDGKIRSPWYDFNSVKLGPRLTKCELDCSFIGTGGEVLDAEILRDLKIFAEQQEFYNPYEHLKGAYRNYKEFFDYIEGHKYLISADVATGDGSDFSTFVVFDLTDFKICATYKDQILPDTFANVLYSIGKDFGDCVIVVENQGGGFTTLQTLKQKGYNNIYYSTLDKKDPSTGKKKRKIGLWASADVRLQGGDQLESKIRQMLLLIPCTVLVEEFYNWIWDTDGKRRHAPGKNDDLIMALQHALWYYNYVFNRSERNRNNFKKIFEVQRNNQSTKISDQYHGKGTFIKNNVAFMPNQRQAIGGNIDTMIDPRVLTQTELEQKTKNFLSNNRRRFFI